MMTINDMIEAGIEFQGNVVVRVWDNELEKAVDVYDGDGDCLCTVCDADDEAEYSGWFDAMRVHYIYPHGGYLNTYVIEVDLDEE